MKFDGTKTIYVHNNNNIETVDIDFLNWENWYRLQS